MGRISVDGTLGFVVFTGLFVGLATGTLYLLLHRWLPAGRAGAPHWGQGMVAGMGYSLTGGPCWPSGWAVPGWLRSDAGHQTV